MDDNEFVPAHLAKKLREVGFAEECLTYWEDSYFKAFIHNGDEWCQGFTIGDLNSRQCLAPLWQQVNKWLFKDHHISINYGPCGITEGQGFFAHCRVSATESYSQEGFKTLEEAGEAAIIWSLKFLNENSYAKESS